MEYASARRAVLWEDITGHRVEEIANLRANTQYREEIDSYESVFFIDIHGSL